MLIINIISLIFVSTLFAFMWRVGIRQGLYNEVGWKFIHAGVGTMVLANLIDSLRLFQPYVRAYIHFPQPPIVLSVSGAVNGTPCGATPSSESSRIRPAACRASLLVK